MIFHQLDRNKNCFGKDIVIEKDGRNKVGKSNLRAYRKALKEYFDANLGAQNRSKSEHSLPIHPSDPDN